MHAVTDDELELRGQIMAAFAHNGAPPAVADNPALRGLVERHVVVLDAAGQVQMAHPFAAHRDGTRVDAGERIWWGNCAWDGLGIVAALGVHEARLSANGLTIDIRDGTPHGDVVFHVSVPARHWWDDIGFT
jgi:hypothetical protein